MTREIIRALVRGLRRFAVRIGRWIIGQIREHGGRAIAHYMRVRVGVFRKRLERVKADWRKRFLRGRIRRWLDAAKWIESRWRQLTAPVLDEADRATQDIGDGVSPYEVAERWRRLAS